MTKPSYRFRSGFEERIYDQGVKHCTELVFEPEKPRITYSIPYRYIPDFYIPRGDIYVEAKGWLRPRDRTKMRKVKEQNPSLDIRFVFQRANSKIGKSKNSETYAEWADRLGFVWAEGYIPEAWFNEKRKKV